MSSRESPTATGGLPSGASLRQTPGRATRSSSRGGYASPNTVSFPVPNTITTPTPSVTSTPQRKRKTRTGRRAACGKDACGVWASNAKCQACAGSPCHAEQIICYACHQVPVGTSGQRVQWRHFQGVEDVAKAATAWRENIERGGVHTIVKPGVSPSMDCFCTRSNCMHALLMKWRRAAEEEGKDKRRCAICAAEGPGAKRVPGAALHAFRDILSQRDPAKPGKIPLGSTLRAGSDLCHKCYMKGYNYSLRVKRGKLEVAGSLAPLTATQSPKEEMVQVNLQESVPLQAGARLPQHAVLPSS